jgi:hypothetical protein
LRLDREVKREIERDIQKEIGGRLMPATVLLRLYQSLTKPFQLDIYSTNLGERPSFAK